jgi:hypothetical protein
MTDVHPHPNPATAMIAQSPRSNAAPSRCMHALARRGYRQLGAGAAEIFVQVNLNAAIVDCWH